MRVTENAGSEALHLQRERQLADGCDTTVITEAVPFVFSADGEMLRTASDYVFNARPPRFDLLSFPSLKHLLKEKEWIDLLAHDVATALGLHQAEKVLVASLSTQPRPLIQRLRECDGIPDGLKVKGFTLRRPRIQPDAKLMALTCMDWRLHMPGGIAAHLAREYGTAELSVFATAGAAKELAHDSARSRMAFAQLELVAGKIGRLVLLSHTDCGKYGGSKAFASPEEELRILCADLDAAKARIETAFPKLKVLTAVARTKGHRCLGIDQRP